MLVDADFAQELIRTGDAPASEAAAAEAAAAAEKEGEEPPSYRFALQPMWQRPVRGLGVVEPWLLKRRTPRRPPTDRRRGFQPPRQRCSRGRQRPRPLSSSSDGGGGAGGGDADGGGVGWCSGGGSAVCDVWGGEGGGAAVRALRGADAVRGGADGSAGRVSGACAFPPCALGEVGLGRGAGGGVVPLGSSAPLPGVVGALLSSGGERGRPRVPRRGVRRRQVDERRRARRQGQGARRQEGAAVAGSSVASSGTVRVSSGVIVCLPLRAPPARRGVRTLRAGGGAAQASRSYVTRTGGPFSSAAPGCHDRGEPS